MSAEKYYLSLIDDCTRFSWLFIKIDWKTENVMHMLESWLHQIKQQAGQMLLVI